MEADDQAQDFLKRMLPKPSLAFHTFVLSTGFLWLWKCIIYESPQLQLMVQTKQKTPNINGTFIL